MLEHDKSENQQETALPSLVSDKASKAKAKETQKTLEPRLLIIIVVSQSKPLVSLLTDLFNKGATKFALSLGIIVHYHKYGLVSIIQRVLKVIVCLFVLLIKHKVFALDDNTQKARSLRQK